MDRRTFLKAAALPCLPPPAAPGEPDSQFLAEAKYYQKLPHKKIRCLLCPRDCVIDDRERGYCGVRENRGGTYYTLVHSRACSVGIDPIEKKPFYHFYPSSLSFSIATAGCNVNCKMCQNWEISQARPEQAPGQFLPPRRVAELARNSGCRSISYTYTEPVIFYEYMIDSAAAGRAIGIKNVVVTGGYIKPEPLRELCRRVDAVKVDLKAFSEKYYREIVSGELKPVLDALVTMRKLGTWAEIVYLVVPGLNDTDAEFRALARWVKTELGSDVPLHFSRFYPAYLLNDLPVTPLETLVRAKAVSDAEGLRFVYLGNVPGHPAEKTYCPGCGRIIVDRRGYTIRSVDIQDGKCRFCWRPVPGIWGA